MDNKRRKVFCIIFTIIVNHETIGITNKLYLHWLLNFFISQLKIINLFLHSLYFILSVLWSSPVIVWPERLWCIDCTSNCILFPPWGSEHMTVYSGRCDFSDINTRPLGGRSMCAVSCLDRWKNQTPINYQSNVGFHVACTSDIKRNRYCSHIY